MYVPSCWPLSPLLFLIHFLLVTELLLCKVSPRAQVVIPRSSRSSALWLPPALVVLPYQTLLPPSSPPSISTVPPHVPVRTVYCPQLPALWKHGALPVSLHVRETQRKQMCGHEVFSVDGCFRQIKLSVTENRRRETAFLLLRLTSQSVIISSQSEQVFIHFLYIYCLLTAA